MERPNITDAHYEEIGRIVLAMPDRNDELKCLQVKKLFNDEEIFDIINDEWYFKAQAFLDKYPTIEDANYFADKIKQISNPPEEEHFIIPLKNSEVKSIALAENTGGNIFNDIITLKNNIVIVVWSEGISIYKDYKHYEIGEDLKSYIFE